MGQTIVLPRMATLVLEMTILPMTMAQWFYSKSLLSWALSAALIITWETAISFCFGVHNPLAGLVGTDYTDAINIFGILIILCLAFALIGSTICYVTQTRDIIPVYACIPLDESERFTRKIDKMEQQFDADGEPIPVLVSKYYTGLHGWGMHDLPRPYMHTLITTVLFILTVATPQLIYSFVMDDQGNDNIIALALVILLPVVGYILTFVFWWFFPDPYVFGPHRKNYKKLGRMYKGYNNFAMLKRDTEKANLRIAKTVAVLGLFQLVGNVVLGFVRYQSVNATAGWIAATVLGGVFLLIGLIVGFLLYMFTPNEADHVYATVVDRAEDEDFTTTPNQEEIVEDENGIEGDDNDSIMPVQEDEMIQEEDETMKQFFMQRMSNMRSHFNILGSLYNVFPSSERKSK